jgi:cyclopropane fatty-acyl-phospholipid synthase-like methyltransferase
MDNKQYWETVYQTKQSQEVSWTQEIPQTSLNFIQSFNLPRSARIIDIGGGDSKFVDYLLEEGFEDITILDISAAALEKAKQRLGDKALKVNWIVSDITDFKPANQFDVWHDRAAFHFLTTPRQIKKYIKTASECVTGFLAIGTFSENGPDTCSGLSIKKYSEKTLTDELAKAFDKLHCITEDHITPSRTKQHFLFCSFKKH